MNAQSLALFLAVSIVSIAMPGPAILYVMSRGVTGGLRSALLAGLGILSADAFYILLSVTGLTAILVASYELFLVIKWIGACYLVYLGAMLLLSAARPPVEAESPTVVGRAGGAWLSGFVLHAGNPKALLYFGSLVPQFVDQSAPLAAQLAVLALIHLLVASTILLAYGALAARLRRSRVGTRTRRAFQAGTGAFLVASGLGLLWLRRASS